jgi:hypothetical protein
MQGESKVRSARAFPLLPPSRAGYSFDTRWFDLHLGLACGFPSVPHGPAKPFSSLRLASLARLPQAADTAVPVQPQNAAPPFWGLNFAGSV